jgi:hypothetical protein
MIKDRMNLTLSQDLKAWYMSRAENYGMSLSGVMVMALAQYREQQQAVSAMSNVDLVMKKLNELDTKIKVK